MRLQKIFPSLACTLLAASLAGGCSGQNPAGPEDAGTAAADASGPAADAAADCPRYVEDVTSCTPASTDYQPRQGVAGANGWPACVSDDGTWHLVGTDVPAASARSAAYDQMATLLWDHPATPTKADFLSARDAYSVDTGLASRVARRQDIHYPEVPGGDKFACQSAGVPAQYPDRCAGPAKLKPIIDDAFEKGLALTAPEVQAARIEAALDWFFYLSMTSEVWTCSFNNIADCDSAAGYYSQLSARDDPKGLARYVDALGPETHDRIWDALLAERCWRDADPAMPAANTALYDRAQAQLAKAALRGEALLLRERIGRVGCLTGDARAAQIAFVEVLGGLIDHDAGLVDATLAGKLKAYTDAPTADAAAIAAAQAAIDAIFGCP
ncbi:MAG TPA: hypothetical protein VGK67_27710 [Myxococcales bacterium]